MEPYWTIVDDAQSTVRGGCQSLREHQRASRGRFQPIVKENMMMASTFMVFGDKSEQLNHIALIKRDTL